MPDHLRAVPPPRLDTDRVLEHLADLDRERAVQQAVVDHVRDVADDMVDRCERDLSALDRRIASLRAHPSVIAALTEGTTHD